MIIYIYTDYIYRYIYLYPIHCCWLDSIHPMSLDHGHEINQFHILLDDVVGVLKEHIQI